MSYLEILHLDMVVSLNLTTSQETLIFLKQNFIILVLAAQFSGEKIKIFSRVSDMILQLLKHDIKKDRIIININFLKMNSKSVQVFVPLKPVPLTMKMLNCLHAFTCKYFKVFSRILIKI